MGTWFGPKQTVNELITIGYTKDEPLQSTGLKAIVLTMDRNTEYMQAEIRKVLDGLNAIPGLKIGAALTMTIDDSSMIDSNEYKVVLEFERKIDG